MGRLLTAKEIAEPLSRTDTFWAQARAGGVPRVRLRRRRSRQQLASEVEARCNWWTEHAWSRHVDVLPRGDGRLAFGTQSLSWRDARSAGSGCDVDRLAIYGEPRSHRAGS